MKDNITERDINQTPMMLMHDCSKLFGHILRRYSEDNGIPSGYRRLMMHLSFKQMHNGVGMTQYELATLAHLTPPTVSVTLQKMERDGLITRTACESDARQMIVTLTDLGLEMERQNHRIAENLEAHILEGIDQDELEAMTATLIKIRDNLRKDDCKHCEPPFPDDNRFDQNQVK